MARWSRSSISSGERHLSKFVNKKINKTRVVAAIQKAIVDWKEKKERQLTHDEDEEMPEEEHIYAVEDVNMTNFYFFFIK